MLLFFQVLARGNCCSDSRSISIYIRYRVDEFPFSLIILLFVKFVISISEKQRYCRVDEHLSLDARKSTTATSMTIKRNFEGARPVNSLILTMKLSIVSFFQTLIAKWRNVFFLEEMSSSTFAKHF